MKLKKMKLANKCSLQQLAEEMPVLGTIDQVAIIGGGSGSFDDPYTLDEIDQMTFFGGGYVTNNGTISWMMKDTMTFGNVDEDWLGNLQEYERTGHRPTSDFIAGEVLGMLGLLGVYKDTVDYWSNNQHIETRCDLMDAIGYGKLGIYDYIHVVRNISGWYHTIETYNTNTGERLTAIKMDIRNGNLTRY